MNRPDSNLFDVCVIGGGINGCGIARDAAGRGYKTLLLEEYDLASATSSKSTKLIHGGLRYLEQFEFRLVHESLQERNRLMNIAGQLIKPLTFILPHEPYIRPYGLIRLGLYLYDLLGLSFQKNSFHKSYGINLLTSPFGASLKNNHRRAIAYSDGWVDDSRLTSLNARDAKERGATIHTYTKCTHITPTNNEWKIETNGQTYRAKIVINAAGPWVRSILDENKLSNYTTPNLKLVKGSHIILPKLYDGDQAYILQQPDKRIVFAIPYEKNYTLIGTTEETYNGDPKSPHISEDETQYLLNIANNTFKTQLSKEDIAFTYSGVRALFDNHTNDNRTTTRDYKIIKYTYNNCPILSIFGGKITTYRALAEQVVNDIDKIFKRKTVSWTGTTPLPQIHIPSSHETTFSENIKLLLDDMIKNEFVKTADDFLWRRTKLGLHFNQAEKQKIEDYIKGKIHE